MAKKVVLELIAFWAFAQQWQIKWKYESVKSGFNKTHNTTQKTKIVNE